MNSSELAEKLKKRSERFGAAALQTSPTAAATSPTAAAAPATAAKSESDDLILKRKQRFGADSADVEVLHIVFLHFHGL